MGERRWVSFCVEVPPGEDERLLMGARIEVPGWSQDFRGEPFRVTGASDAEALRVILPDVDLKELAESVVITERGDFVPITSSNRHPTGVLLDLARSLLAAMTEGETDG